MIYMKSLFLSLLICVGLFTQKVNAQTACSNFHRKACYMEGTRRDAREFMYNAQSKSGLFAQGTVSKLRCIVYKGNDYRISVCCEVVLGEKVNFKIYDVKNRPYRRHWQW